MQITIAKPVKTVGRVVLGPRLVGKQYARIVALADGSGRLRFMTRWPASGQRRSARASSATCGAPPRCPLPFYPNARRFICRLRGVFLMAKPNYAYQKRQRDLAKKQKKEEKRLKKAGTNTDTQQTPPARPEGGEAPEQA